MWLVCSAKAHKWISMKCWNKSRPWVNPIRDTLIVMVISSPPRRSVSSFKLMWIRSRRNIMANRMRMYTSMSSRLLNNLIINRGTSWYRTPLRTSSTSWAKRSISVRWGRHWDRNRCSRTTNLGHRRVNRWTIHPSSSRTHSRISLVGGSGSCWNEKTWTK